MRIITIVATVCAVLLMSIESFAWFANLKPTKCKLLTKAEYQFLKDYYRADYGSQYDEYFNQYINAVESGLTSEYSMDLHMPKSSEMVSARLISPDGSIYILSVDDDEFELPDDETPLLSWSDFLQHWPQGIYTMEVTIEGGDTQTDTTTLLVQELDFPEFPDCSLTWAEGDIIELSSSTLPDLDEFQVWVDDIDLDEEIYLSPNFNNENSFSLLLSSVVRGQGNYYINWNGEVGLPRSGNFNINIEIEEEFVVAKDNSTTPSITGTITANVSGSSFNIQDATVSLRDTAYTTTTDKSGHFDLINIPQGTYTLVISAPDLAPVIQQITVNEGQTLSLDLAPMTVQQCGIPGDLNGDGKVGLDDTIYILQILTGT